MHPLLRALLSTWDWRFDISLLLLAFTTLYTVGWWRLRQRGRRKVATRRRLAAYWSGIFTLALALMSPIDPLGGQLFFMHMIQHMITIMVSAPLLWLGAPFPFLLWGLPSGVRKWVGQQFAQASLLRSGLQILRQPALVWMAFVAVYGGWHDPMLYDLALRHAWVHDIQHITFFGTAMMLWWVVIDAAPRLQSTSVWGRIIMVVGVIPVNMAVGITIATAQEVIYPYYATVPRIWGFTAVADQSTAGVIMWTSGSEMLVLAVIFLLASAMRGEKKPPTPMAAWDREEALIAPGLEHRARQNKWRRVQAAALPSSTNVS